MVVIKPCRIVTVRGGYGLWENQSLGGSHCLVMSVSCLQIVRFTVKCQQNGVMHFGAVKSKQPLGLCLLLDFGGGTKQVLVIRINFIVLCRWLRNVLGMRSYLDQEMATPRLHRKCKTFI